MNALIESTIRQTGFCVVCVVYVVCVLFVCCCDWSFLDIVLLSG